MTRSSVLLWPTGWNDKTHNLDQPGYILGWDDDESDDSKPNLNFTDISVASNHKNRTTICIGIIPQKQQQQQQQVHDVSRETNEIQKFITNWSKQYLCHANNNGDGDKHNNGRCRYNSITRLCHCRIKIIGLWIPNTTKNQIVSNLPEIIPTEYGPWWRTKMEKHDNEQQQLLLYDPCENLSHFRHCFPWNASSASDTSLTDTNISRNGFQKTLLRLNEANEIFESLQKYIMTNTSGDTTNTNNRDKSTPLNTNEIARTQEKVSSADQGRTNVTLVKSFMQSSLLAIRIGEHLAHSFVPFSGLFYVFRRNNDSQQFPSFVPQEIAARQFINRFEKRTSAALDSILGVLAGFLLIYRVDSVLLFIKHTWDIFHSQMLRDNVGWLETFPAGFKLNVALTQSMGKQISLFLHLHDFTTSSILTLFDTIVTRIMVAATKLPSSQELLLILIGCIGCALGFLTMLAAVFDILRILTIHIYCLVTIFQKIHQWQLYLLSSLWRLFRGKKKNVLRHRTDTMDYDYMQLLLGMILFTAVLFVFTTILVYYMFFTALNLTIHGVYILLWTVYVFVRNFPVGTVILRVQSPSWFTRKVFTEDCQKIDLEYFIGDAAIILKPTQVQATKNAPYIGRNLGKLETVPQTMSEIISEAISQYFKTLLSNIPSFISEILSGKPCSVLEVCLKCIRI